MTTTDYKDIKVRKHYDVAFPIVNTIILVLLMFVTLYPVINTVAYSLNDGTDALKAGIGLWPRMWSTKSYQAILQDPAVYQAAWISASKTVITTLLNLFWTSMLAYVLSRKEFVLRKIFTVILVLTDEGIVEQGTHDELMRRKGVYYGLYRMYSLNNSEEREIA